MWFRAQKVLHRLRTLAGESDKALASISTSLERTQVELLEARAALQEAHDAKKRAQVSATRQGFIYTCTPSFPMLV